MAGLLIFFICNFERKKIWKGLFLWLNYVLMKRFDTIFHTSEKFNEEIMLPHLPLFQNPLFLLCFLRERKAVYNGISEILEFCHHQDNLFCNFWCVILIYAKGLAKDILVVVSPFLYIYANCTPHPSRQDIGFFLVGRCCSQHFIPGGYFRFLVLLPVLFGRNRWSVFEIMNPF